MRIFRFIGDSSKFKWSKNPEFGMDYSVEEINRMRGYKGTDLDELDLSIRKNEWQEVFDKPKTLHKDTDLGYFSLEVMKSVFQSPSVKQGESKTTQDFISDCIGIAKELIKQLNQETK